VRPRPSARPRFGRRAECIHVAQRRCGGGAAVALNVSMLPSSAVEVVPPLRCSGLSAAAAAALRPFMANAVKTGS